MGGRLDHLEASSQHVWHLDEFAVTVERWSPMQPPHAAWAFQSTEAEF